MFGVLALGDGAAVTGISTRKSSLIQTNSWESLEEGVQGTESGGTFWQLSSWGSQRATTADIQEAAARHARSWLLKLMKDPRNLPKT